MLVRLEHIDGTVEPAVSSRDDSELLEEIGTMFALPDGRWVQVIGHERESDGSIRYVIVGETPEVRTYSATGHEGYVRGAGEWAMGSEQYGTLMLDGSPLDVGSRVEDSSLIWSPDGRYLAATVSDLVINRDASGRRQVGTKVIVIDGESRQVVGGSEERSGRASPLAFVGRSLLYKADDEDSWVNLRF
jgi:hypothetical protein